jgi:hypothetical protein
MAQQPRAEQSAQSPSCPSPGLWIAVSLASSASKASVTLQHNRVQRLLRPLVAFSLDLLESLGLLGGSRVFRTLVQDLDGEF